MLQPSDRRLVEPQTPLQVLQKTELALSLLRIEATLFGLPADRPVRIHTAPFQLRLP